MVETEGPLDKILKAVGGLFHESDGEESEDKLEGGWQFPWESTEEGCTALDGGRKEASTAVPPRQRRLAVLNIQGAAALEAMPAAESFVMPPAEDEDDEGWRDEPRDEPTAAGSRAGPGAEGGLLAGLRGFFVP